MYRRTQILAFPALASPFFNYTLSAKSVLLKGYYSGCMPVGRSLYEEAINNKHDVKNDKNSNRIKTFPIQFNSIHVVCSCHGIGCILTPMALNGLKKRY